MGSLAEEFTLKIGQCREHVDDEFPSRAASVDRLLQRLKRDSARFELADDANEVLQVPTKAVKAPDNECVAVAQCFQAVDEFCRSAVLPLALSA